jgi:hypothetical protein
MLGQGLPWGYSQDGQWGWAQLRGDAERGREPEPAAARKMTPTDLPQGGRSQSRPSTIGSISYCPAVSTLRDAALWLAKTAQERFCRSTISPGWSLVRT